MDGALLLVAGNEACPQPQTEEHLAADHNGVYGPGFETLRWFPLPHEVVRRLKGETEAATITHPLRLRCDASLSASPAT